jgi:cytoskeletal protein CcmA (bactofilin family)
MRKQKKFDSISTFLGSDARVEGSVEFQGTIRVDGHLKGKISSNGGTLIVGEKARIHADVIVGAVIVMGEINGSIDAKERIEVYPPGRVGGDIQAPVISIEPGGLFNGNCVMNTQSTPLKKSVAPTSIASISEGSKAE